MSQLQGVIEAMVLSMYKDLKLVITPETTFKSTFLN